MSTVTSNLEEEDMGLYQPRVLMIGAGLTSSFLSLLISRNEKLSERVHIHVWEAESRIGGRFATFKCPRNLESCADLGAQYLTQSRGHPSKEYYEELLKAGLLREMNTSGIPGFRHDDTKLNYACTKGTASIIQFYFDQVKECRQIDLKNKVTRLNVTTLSGKPKIQVWNSTNEREVFDIVISTIPVPQLLEISNVSNILKSVPHIESDLQKVTYSSRFVAALFYKYPFKLEENTEPIHFVSDPKSPIRYWSIEPVKRSGNPKSSEPGSILAHTSAGYGTDCDFESHEFQDSVWDAVKELIQPLPIPAHHIYSKLRHWKYSQVTTPYPGTPGFVKLLDKPLLLATGDSFTASGFEGCLTAAGQAFQCLESYCLNMRKDS